MEIFKRKRNVRTIDNNKSAFLSAILFLPEFHSRKLISIVSRFCTARKFTGPM